MPVRSSVTDRCTLCPARHLKPCPGAAGLHSPAVDRLGSNPTSAPPQPLPQPTGGASVFDNKRIKVKYKLTNFKWQVPAGAGLALSHSGCANTTPHLPDTAAQGTDAAPTEAKALALRLAAYSMQASALKLHKLASRCSPPPKPRPRSPRPRCLARWLAPAHSTLRSLHRPPVGPPAG